MKLLNPFMPYRYLHPRASGLIAYKGGGGGATAAQVDESVQGGVTTVNENTNAGFAETAAMGETITNNQATMTGNQNTMMGNQDTMLSNQNTLTSGQTGLSNQIAAIPQTRVVNQTVDTSGIENRIGSLEGVTDTGFATVNSNLDGVRGSVNSGFSDMNQSFNDVAEGQTNIQNSVSDLSGNMTDRFNTVDSSLDTGFAGVNENVNTQFDTQNQSLTDLSANVLGGQTSLQEYLEGMSDRATTYYGGLSDGQANIQSSVGGLQDNFSDFRSEYSDDATLATQARADLVNQVTGGFGQVRDDLNRNFDATSQQNASIARNTEQTMRNQDDMSTNFGSAFKQISSGVQAQTAGQQQTKQDMLQRLSTIREVILGNGQNLDPALTMEYAKLADSFDGEGRLIQQSNNKNGSVTQRGFDANNNLNIATFSQQGQITDRSRINIDKLMSQMDQMGYGGSSSPGLMVGSQPFSSTAA